MEINPKFKKTIIAGLSLLSMITPLNDRAVASSTSNFKIEISTNTKTIKKILMI